MKKDVVKLGSANMYEKNKMVSDKKYTGFGPIQDNNQHRQNGFRVNPLAKPIRNRNPQHLSSAFQLVQRKSNGFKAEKAYKNGIIGHNHIHKNNQHPVFADHHNPEQLDSLFLNQFGIHPVVAKNVIKSFEYLKSMKTNFAPKYNERIQKEIAQIQEKPMAIVGGNTVSVSFDGPGIQTDILPKSTNITMNSRFAQL